jgi:hypothetical protein
MGVLFMSPSTPPSLDKAATLDRVPVGSHRFTDQRTIELEITETPPYVTSARTSGTITSSSCVAGGTITSGASTFEINGIPLVNLATEIPLWRRLVVGAHGDDVRSLQSELVRLGASIDIDSVVGPETLAALRKLVPAIGDSRSIDPALVVWLPASELQAVSCPAQVGRDVTSGDPLVEFAGSGTNVLITSLPQDLLPGAREIVIDDVVIPLFEDMRVEDAELRQRLLRTDAYRAVREEGEVARVPTALRLVEAVQVSSVPPSSVFQRGGSSCVAAPFAVHRVTVVGSALGQSFVVFEGDIPQEVFVHPEEAGQGCR